MALNAIRCGGRTRPSDATAVPTSVTALFPDGEIQLFEAIHQRTRLLEVNYGFLVIATPFQGLGGNEGD